MQIPFAQIYNKNIQKRLTIHKLLYIISSAMLSGYGGIGRRVRLRGVWETIRVQVPVTAPISRRGCIEKEKFASLFFISPFATNAFT